MPVIRDNNRGNLVQGTANRDTIFGNGGDDTIYGGRTTSEFDFDTLTGNDVINGGKGNDTSYGMDGDDIFVASAGGDTAYGGVGSNSADYRGVSSGIELTLNSNIAGVGGAAGDFVYGMQRVWGSRHADDITGNSSATTSLYGGGGDDTLMGGSAVDYLFGDAGDDYLDGNAFNDRLYGGKGDDTVDGGDGNDLIYGGKGVDRLSGGDGADSLYGGKGGDILNNGAGDATMFGGAGADSYNFDASLEGREVIDDFSLNGGDRIVLASTDTYNTFADVQADLTSDAQGNAVFRFGDQMDIVLRGVAVADLTADDFLL